MKVLIIEDSEEFLKAAVRRIKRLGHELVNPEQVTSVEQAVALIREHNPEIVLLDMNYGSKFYPDGKADGCKVTAQLTSEECARIICMSGTPKCYEKYLRPLGVKHFGGKTGFEACLTNTCKCNNTA